MELANSSSILKVELKREFDQLGVGYELKRKDKISPRSFSERKTAGQNEPVGE